mgnify:CR=1 FL=1
MIGKGSFGEVVKGMNVKDGSIFAVKKLNIFSSVTGVNNEVIKILKVNLIIKYINN